MPTYSQLRLIARALLIQSSQWSANHNQSAQIQKTAVGNVGVEYAAHLRLMSRSQWFYVRTAGDRDTFPRNVFLFVQI
jgi:hypothetical protein